MTEADGGLKLLEKRPTYASMEKGTKVEEREKGEKSGRYRSEPALNRYTGREPCPSC